MLHIVKKISFQHSILSIEKSGKYIFVIDGGYNLHFIEIENYNLIKSVCVVKEYPLPHKYSNATAISRNNLFFFPLLGAKKGVVVELEGGIKKKGVIDWHEGDIESASFSKNGKYFATGGTDGKTFIFNTSDLSLVTSLPPRPDYICDLTFSNKSDKLACSGFDKFVVLYDITLNRITNVIKTPDVPEKVKFFDHDKFIYMVLRNGGSLIYDVTYKKILSTENLFSVWPSYTDISPDNKFGVVGSRSESLYAIKLEENIRILEIKLEYNGVASLKFFDNILAIGTIDGNLIFIDYKAGDEEFVKFLESRNFAMAREKVNKNLFLSIHPNMKLFDEAWPEILKKSIELLNENRIDEALMLTDPFTVDSGKKKEFDFYMSQKSIVSGFVEAVSKREFQKAFELTLQNRFLTKTLAYEAYEKEWLKAFNTAKKLLEESPLQNQKMAQNTLKPFELTDKKEIIAMLLKNYQVFSQADALIKQRKFKAYFDLVGKFPFLEGTDLFKKVKSLSDKFFDEFNILEQKGDFTGALEKAKFISDFPFYKKAIKDRLLTMAAKEKFVEAVTKHNIKLAYDLLDKNELLRGMPAFNKLKEDFEERYNNSLVYAKEGEPKKTMSSMSAYMEIPFWKDRIAILLKKAYIAEMGSNLHRLDINWYLTFKRYMDRFGKDEEIKKLVKNSELEAELEKIPGEGEASGYKRKNFLDSIIVELAGSNE